MRPIKIRVWIPEKHKMVPMLTISDDFHPMILLTPPDGKGWIAMQYTGLKDKTGKEIYEGDILKHSRYISDVKFKRGMFIVKDKYKEEALSKSGYVNSTIIGNIYENPELLHLKSNRDSIGT